MACINAFNILSSLVKHKPSNSDFLFAGAAIVKILKAIAPFLIKLFRLELVSFPIAGIKAKLIMVFFEKCSFLSFSTFPLDMHGSLIGISNSVVIPPFAAAFVSLSTVPLSGNDGALT